jgi:hypothetical protein
MVFFALALSVAGRLSFDKTGSYNWSFVLSAAMAAIALISVLMIREKDDD